MPILAGRLARPVSGTGAAVMAMTARGTAKFPIQSIQAEEVPELQPYLKDTGSEVRQLLDAGKRVVVEGTQGFGLSLFTAVFGQGDEPGHYRGSFLGRGRVEPSRRR